MTRIGSNKIGSGNAGDVVAGVVSRDYGKPRPAVVVQSDYFNETHASVTVCPITSHLIDDAPLFRMAVEPGGGTGLKASSQDGG
jgi:mRNA interferase MazF